MKLQRNFVKMKQLQYTVSLKNGRRRRGEKDEMAICDDCKRFFSIWGLST